MTPYYVDDWLTVYHGDCKAVMADMEPESVHCVVTSPPYWGLRDYGDPGRESRRRQSRRGHRCYRPSIRRRPSHPQARGRAGMTGTLSQPRRRAEAEQAEDYAWTIRNAGWIKPDWQALNARLIDEFGLGGLVRIKRAAWKLIEDAR